jgi:FkbM family methyltransferase
MIELGSFWAYYSLWFNKAIKNAKNYCFEPDPTNLSFGKKNATINDCKMHFEEAAAGSQHNSIITLPLDSDPSVLTRVKVVSVDGFAKRTNIQKIDLLHMDVQGVELDALVGASESIKKGMVRFIIVSTHHYMFSGDPMTHKKCMDFIESHGGTIIASHTILESFSGDGLIVASFDAKDTNMTIDMSYNHADKALFRSYEDDLGRIFNANVKN